MRKLQKIMRLRMKARLSGRAIARSIGVSQDNKSYGTAAADFNGDGKTDIAKSGCLSVSLE